MLPRRFSIGSSTTFNCFTAKGLERIQTICGSWSRTASISSEAQSESSLKQTSKLLSRISTTGTGFWQGPWQMVRKNALSSTTKSRSFGRVYDSKNESTMRNGSSREEKDSIRDSLVLSPFTPAERSSIRRSQSRSNLHDWLRRDYGAIYRAIGSA